MPYKSKDQQKAMHAKASRGEIAQNVIKEFDRTTSFSNLPKTVKKSFYEAGFKYALDGMGLSESPGNLSPPKAPAAVPKAPKMPSPSVSSSAVLQTNAANVANTPMIRFNEGSTFPVAQ
jgi:hypothetical protein